LSTSFGYFLFFSLSTFVKTNSPHIPFTYIHSVRKKVWRYPGVDTAKERVLDINRVGKKELKKVEKELTKKKKKEREKTAKKEGNHVPWKNRAQRRRDVSEGGSGRQTKGRRLALDDNIGVYSEWLLEEKERTQAFMKDAEKTRLAKLAKVANKEKENKTKRLKGKQIFFLSCHLFLLTPPPPPTLTYSVVDVLQIHFGLHFFLPFSVSLHLFTHTHTYLSLTHTYLSLTHTFLPLSLSHAHINIYDVHTHTHTHIYRK